MSPRAPDALGIAIDASGWMVAQQGAAFDVRRVPSPNCDARPAGCAATLLVIHNISLPPGVFGGDAIEALFTNTLAFDAHPSFEALRDLRVSSHFLVRRDGEVVQFVSCDARAWHAGASAFEGRERCNDFSIGIELEGTDANRFEPIQYRRVVSLTDALSRRYPLEAAAGHSDVAPGRKTDPGPHFDWRRFHARVRPALRGPHATAP